MPPRTYAVAEDVASPPPAMGSDTQDLLVIQDLMDTLDQLPMETTRVHSDLNELGAVLYSTLLNLEKKLNQLIIWIQDASVGPEKRFQLLQEIAEEAARYKLGGDDKIRVAGGACDGILSHQKHISTLLANSTLLLPVPVSPYTQSLTLTHLPPTSNTRRGQLARIANSPFGGRAYMPVPPVNGESRERDTPTKKKRSRMQQLGKEDDDASSIGGGEKKKGPIKKRKVRAISPIESIGSASVFTGKPTQPQTARQLAAAANKARKVEREDDSDDDERDQPSRMPNSQPSQWDDFGGLERKDGGFGLDAASREGSNLGGRSANATPTLLSAAVMVSRPTRGKEILKHGGEDEEDDESDGEEEAKPIPRRNTSLKKVAQQQQQQPQQYDIEMSGGGGLEAGDGGGEDVDSKVYCTCRQLGYGEMIGCDDDECEIEWYHLVCLNLDKTPEGIWICPACVERRKKHPKGRKAPRSKGARK